MALINTTLLTNITIKSIAKIIPVVFILINNKLIYKKIIINKQI